MAEFNPTRLGSALAQALLLSFLTLTCVSARSLLQANATEEGPRQPEACRIFSIELAKKGYTTEYLQTIRTEHPHGMVWLEGGAEGTTSGVVHMSICGYSATVSSTGLYHFIVYDEGDEEVVASMGDEDDPNSLIAVNTLRAGSICASLGRKSGRFVAGSAGKGSGLVLQLAPVCREGAYESRVQAAAAADGGQPVAETNACYSTSRVMGLLDVDHSNDLVVECAAEAALLGTEQATAFLKVSRSGKMKGPRRPRGIITGPVGPASSAPIPVEEPLNCTEFLAEVTRRNYDDATLNASRTDKPHGSAWVVGGPNNTAAGVVQVSWCGFKATILDDGTRYYNADEHGMMILGRGVKTDPRTLPTVNSMRAGTLCQMMGYATGRYKTDEQKFTGGEGLVLEIQPVCNTGEFRRIMSAIDVLGPAAGAIAEAGACRPLWRLGNKYSYEHGHDLSVECYGGNNAGARAWVRRMLR